MIIVESLLFRINRESETWKNLQKKKKSIYGGKSNSIFISPFFLLLLFSRPSNINVRHLLFNDVFFFFLSQSENANGIIRVEQIDNYY